jgi:hypothetical protein
MNLDKEEIDKMVDLFNSPVKNIYRENNSTIVEFQNGKTIPLYGQSFEIETNGPKCNFCKEPSNGLIFTVDDENYICLQCTLIALEVFVQNGADIQINLTDNFPGLAKQIKKLSNNLDDM